MGKRRADGNYKRSFKIDGKTYYVYGKSKAELTEKESKKREEIAKGIEKRTDPTFSQYVERWIDSRRGSVSDSTIRTQGKIIDTVKGIRIEDLQCNFGELKIRKITIDDLRTVQGALKKTRKTQTVNDYMALLKHVFSDAIKERIIDYNPAVLLKNLKRTEERARDTNHRALTLEEQTGFFDCKRCKDSYYYNVFRIAITTGMRIGEIGALRYSDIKEDQIHVERTITRTESGAYVIGESAKTEAGRRVIPINDQIAKILEDQKELNSAIDGNVIPLNALLFKAPERGLLQSTPADREIKRICKAAGIEPFTMHAFRDTFATRAIEAGMNPKTLQEILGHTDFSLTMSLYGHCMADTKKQAMKTINIAI